MYSRTTLVVLLVCIFTTRCPHPVASQCTSQFCFGDDKYGEMSSAQLNLNSMPLFLAIRDKALANAQEELFNQRRTIDNQKLLLYDLTRTVANEELEVLTQQRELNYVRETLYEIQLNVSAVQHEQLNQGHDSAIHGDTIAALAQTLTSYKRQIEDQDNKLAKQTQMLQTLRQEITALKRHPLPAYDCVDILQDGHTTSGEYSVFLSRARKYTSVYCDMETDGGGWLVIQRRQDGSVNFVRNWETYKKGFGDVSGEFWLGNDYLHDITSNKNYEIRVDMEDWDGVATYAVYSNFVVAAEEDNYTMTLEAYRGTAGDSLRPCRDNAFCTIDRDNDKIDMFHAAHRLMGGWWYDRCHNANLNGRYFDGRGRIYLENISWKQEDGKRHSLKKVDMKLRPRND